MKYYRITSEKKKQFFADHGIYPVYEKYDTAYYKRNAAFFSLLETFEIRFNCFPNKL